MNNLKIKDGFKGERSLIMPEMILRLSAADPVLRNLHITDIGYYPHATYHYRERVQPIDQYVLIYCVKGSGRYKVDGKEHVVKENQYFILPAMKPHAYASNNCDPWTIYWIHFSGLQAGFYAEGAEEPHDIPAGMSSRIADRNDIFEDIFSVLSDSLATDSLRYASSMLHYYLASLRYLPLYRKFHASGGSISEESSVIVNAILKYMEENVERQLSLETLARYAGYSPSHFSAIFKAATGHSPLSYFNLVKIRYACKLMDTTDMKINQICCKVGIDDSFYFSRLFKKTVGISPRQYRDSEAVLK